ncbi:hypothetical protein ElyMa_001511100 [Elysia marginata]|uniref:Uncharacterized protein n=1 Tax=Elysia marginata TaxID=1093978 RepID=A0AAV4J6L9_9GAST|nr:hypothetical protein ElyMa_001511100 [Elysia marginata]
MVIERPLSVRLRMVIMTSLWGIPVCAHAFEKLQNGVKIDGLEEKSSQIENPREFWENKQARHPPTVGTRAWSWFGTWLKAT